MLSPGNAEDRIMDALQYDYLLTEEILKCETLQDFRVLGAVVTPLQKSNFAFNANLLQFPLYMIELIETSVLGDRCLLEMFGNELPDEVFSHILTGKNMKVVTDALKICDNPELLRLASKYIISQSEKKAWLENIHTPSDCVVTFAGDPKNHLLIASSFRSQKLPHHSEEVLEQFMLSGSPHLQLIALNRKVPPEVAGLGMSLNLSQLKYFIEIIDAVNDEKYQIDCFEHFLVYQQIMTEDIVGQLPSEYVKRVVMGMVDETVEVR